MRRIAGAVAAAGAAVLALGAVVGCTKSPPLVAAVRLEAGKPVVVLAACHGLVPDDITVFPLNEGASRVSWRIKRRSGPALTRAELLGAPPAGWRTETNTLPRLAPGVTYSLFAWQGTRASTAPAFTTEQLAALPAGKVLAAYSDVSGTKAVTEAEFRDHAC